MQWCDDVKIETPEQIDVSLEVAGLGSRFVARVIDWLFKGGILLLLGIVVLILEALLEDVTRDKTVRMVLLALLVGLVYAFFLGFDIYYEVRRSGQTPGKKMAGVRAIRESGAPLDFRSAGIRNLLRLADMLPSFYLLGGFLVLLTSRGQRLGDLAAGTIVVRERALAPPVDLNQEIERLASVEFAFTAEQLAACALGDRHILRSFFLRSEEMEEGPRRRLASRLAKEFLRKTSYPLAAPLGDGRHAEAFLASLYRDLGSRG